MIKSTGLGGCAFEHVYAMVDTEQGTFVWLDRVETATVFTIQVQPDTRLLFKIRNNFFVL